MKIDMVMRPDDMDAHDIGKVIKVRRVMLEMSQADLARSAGVSTTEVCRIESGDRLADALWKLQEMLLALGLTFKIEELNKR